ncbi:MAG: transcriptional regulator, AraC family [Clostridiaceae bacterium]|nr:transcriptional regulator, AraC family [Clostridiaceae bacterium]
MEKCTVDNKRGLVLQIYFDLDGDFIKSYNSMFRIVYVIEGSGIVKINDQAVVFSSPALFCFNEEDHVVLQKNVKIKCQIVHFNPTVINDELKLHIIRKDNYPLPDTAHQDWFLLGPFIYREEFGMPYIEIGPITSKRISMLFDGLREELTCLENDFWRCRSRSYLLETLFLIQNMITDLKSRESFCTQVPSEDINHIILYLNTNYNRKVTIEEITDTFHLNRTTLSEKFRKSTGISIMGYLMKYRIRMASVMLRETMLPISEILNRVGFNDSVHFSRTFKKHTGCTPSDYREKYIGIVLAR